jgi:hypothetical protein
MSGWVKIHRRLASHELWDADPFSRGQAWVDLIFMANHKDRFVSGEKVKKGGIITSQVKLAKRWGWSRSKTQRFLSYLEKEGMIKMSVSTKRAYLTICNYESYNSSVSSKRAGEKEKQPVSSKRAPLPQIKTTTSEESRAANEHPQKEVKERAYLSPIKTLTSEESRAQTRIKIKDVKKKEDKLYTLNTDVSGEGFSSEVFELAQCFLETLNERQRESVEKNQSTKSKWLDALDKCIRIDGYKFEELKEIIIHFRNDSFWSSNFLSPVKLRLKNKEGVRYAEVFSAKLSNGSRGATIQKRISERSEAKRKYATLFGG